MPIGMRCGRREDMPKPHSVLLTAYRAQAGKGVQTPATVYQIGEQYSRSEACQECPLQRGFFGTDEVSRATMGRAGAGECRYAHQQFPVSRLDRVNRR